MSKPARIKMEVGNEISSRVNISSLSFCTSHRNKYFSLLLVVIVVVIYCT